MVRRIFGSDVNPINQQLLGATGREVGRQQQMLQSGLEQAMATGQSISQDALRSLQAQRELTSTLASVHATKQQQAARGNDFFGNLADLFGNLNQAQQARAKAALQRQQDRGKQEFALANAQIEQHVAGAEDYMRQYGSGTFRKEGLRMIGSYPNISPTDVINLTDTLEKRIGIYETEQSKKRVQMNEELFSVKQEYISAQLKYNLTGLTTQLKNAKPEQVPEFMGKIQDHLAQWRKANPGFTPLQIAQIERPVYEAALKDAQIGVEAQTALQLELDRFDGFIAAYSEIVKDPKTSKVEQQYLVDRAALEFQIESGVAQRYLNAAQKENVLENLVKSERLQQEYTELQDKKDERSISLRKLNRETVKSLVLVMQYDETTKATLLNGKQRHDPNVVAAKAVQEKYAKYLKEAPLIQYDIDSVIRNRMLQDRSIQSFIANKGKTSLDADIARIEHVINMRLNRGGDVSELEQIKQQMIGHTQQQNPWNISDEDAARAVENWIQINEALMKTYDDEITFHKKKLENLKFMELGSLDLPEDVNAFRSEEAQQTLNNIIQELEAVVNDYRRNDNTNDGDIEAGAAPNFQLGDRAKNLFLKDATTGREYPVPFPAGTEGVIITSPQGMRGDRPHRGVDFGHVQGGHKLLNTPLISLVNGVVKQVKNQPDGYGHYIDIVSNGTLYRYAHLSEAPTLRAGDAVVVGQTVGKFGNSGRSSAPHLHFEIRQDGAVDREGPGSVYGKHGEHNVLNYLLGQYQQDKAMPAPGNEDYTNVPNPSEVTSNEEFQSIVPARAVKDNDNVIIDNVVKLPSPPDAPKYAKAEEVYNTAEPLRNKFLRADKINWDAKTNKPTNHYGYDALVNDAKLAANINKVATILDVPGLWLADLIAYESGFDPLNQNSIAGLSGIADFTETEIRDAGYDPTTWHLTTASEQMLVLEQRVKNAMELYGKPRNFRDVAAMFYSSNLEVYNDVRNNGGLGLVNTMKDVSGMSFQEYLRKIGGNANRQYEASNQQQNLAAFAPIHTEYVEGCAHCRALRASGSEIIPHEGLIA